MGGVGVGGKDRGCEGEGEAQITGCPGLCGTA